MLAALTAGCGGVSEGSGGPGEQAGGVTRAQGSPLATSLAVATRRHAKRSLGPDVTPGSPLGFVAFEQCTAGTGCATEHLSAAYALFYTSPDEECTVTLTDGACSALTCEALTAVAQSAGALTLGGFVAGSKTLEPDKKNGLLYEWVKTGGRTQIEAGATLSASADGATVPAFGAQGIVAPSLIAMREPAIPKSGDLSISTASDLALSWTKGEAGDYVMVTLAPSAGSSSIQCNFDASAGSGTLPQDVLATLSGSGIGTFEWGQYTQSVFEAGAYQVVESVDAYGSAQADVE